MDLEGKEPRERSSRKRSEELGRKEIMKRLFIMIFFAIAACSGEDPCDRCYDADYYYDHPYYCQECLEEKDDMASGKE